MLHKFYKIIRKNILFFLLMILLFSLFINIPIWLNSKGKLFYSLKDLPEKKVVLVLGTSKFLENGKKNLFYLYRIQAAKKILDSGKVEKLVLSGSKDVGYDEVEWMKKDLMKMGVEGVEIILDKEGNRTEKSIHNLVLAGYNEFIVVSQKFHLERAVFLASLSGVTAYGYIAESPDTIYSSRVYLREIFARIKLLFVDILFG